MQLLQKTSVQGYLTREQVSLEATLTRKVKKSVRWRDATFSVARQLLSHLYEKVCSLCVLLTSFPALRLQLSCSVKCRWDTFKLTGARSLKQILSLLWLFPLWITGSSHALIILVTMVVSRIVIHKLTKQNCVLSTWEQEKKISLLDFFFNRNLNGYGIIPASNRLNSTQIHSTYQSYWFL